MPDEWTALSTLAHKIAFNEERPADFNTFDFALVAFDADTIYGYGTLIEMDKESIYIQHGGAMPPLKGKGQTKELFGAGVKWLLERYKRVSFRVHNKNLPMIKLGFSTGFLICGCETFKDKTLLTMRCENE